jgi:phosphoserine phosphatase
MVWRKREIADKVAEESMTLHEKQKAKYISYMMMNIELEDWHAVSDAANDLRVLEARYERDNG